MRNRVQLSDEQQRFVDSVLAGKNVLVDACIGSGKTTAIQRVCNLLPSSKKILYLTYNKLLKCDARAKILNANVNVTNYHGFAWSSLRDNQIPTGVNDSVTIFNQVKPIIEKYDVLIIDEYQDIELEHSLMLKYIKSQNPKMQLVAVGDMEQKIYDKTTLDVYPFIDEFLGKHECLGFTRCFRLSATLATQLGNIWGKPIVGVNPNCIVETMDIGSVYSFIRRQKLSDLLCLGARYGACMDVLNDLETHCPDIFNKHTVYASIRENDSMSALSPTSETAIFTTFDSSKGLERPICILFDYTETYWHTRSNKPGVRYEIIRNIFCVAASRGKRHIIFVEPAPYKVKGVTDRIVSPEVLAIPTNTFYNYVDVNMSSMFDFKFIEDIVECYKTLKVRQVDTVNVSDIDVKCSDGLIDLSRCIGIYQEASYFKKYNIDKDIQLYLHHHQDQECMWTKARQKASLEQKILFLTALETHQQRYEDQVELPLVTETERDLIHNRIGTHLEPTARIQVGCQLHFGEPTTKAYLFTARGFADAVKGDTVYELKFVSELTYEHFLQCASYMVAMKKPKGILWNVRTNKMFEITVPNKRKFLDAVVTAVTRHRLTKYCKPKGGIPDEELSFFV